MARPRGTWAQKQFRDALQIVVNEESGGLKKLRLIAEKLVESAIAGEGWAIQQVADRLDGKPPQELAVEGNISHELASLTDAELAARIQRELGAIAGRVSKAPGEGKLH